MKTCQVCLKNKSYDHFYDNLTCKDGYGNTCKSCLKEYAKYRKEKQKLLPKKPKQKIFYSPTTPRLPDPNHQILIEKGSIRIDFS